MPSEINKPAESAHEVILDAVQSDEQDERSWTKWVALTAMVMALFSTVGALLAGITSTESLMVRTEEILELSRLENDRLHIEILRSKHDLVRSMGQLPDEAEVLRILEYEKDVAALETIVGRDEVRVVIANQKHTVFALGVTLLSIAITLSGMSIIASRQILWYVGIVFGLVGCGFVSWGIFTFL